jgi:hypothetical protein
MAFSGALCQITSLGISASGRERETRVRVALLACTGGHCEVAAERPLTPRRFAGDKPRAPTALIALAENKGEQCRGRTLSVSLRRNRHARSQFARKPEKASGDVPLKRRREACSARICRARSRLPDYRRLGFSRGYRKRRTGYRQQGSTSGATLSSIRRRASCRRCNWLPLFCGLEACTGFARR